MRRINNNLYLDVSGLTVILPTDSQGTPNFTDAEFARATYDAFIATGEPIPYTQVSAPPITPDPEGFLKYCFAGTDPELSQIFQSLFAQTFADNAAARWYDQVIHGSRPGLFVITNPPEAGGWHYALVNLARVVTLGDSQRAIANSALVKFGLFPVL